MIPTLPGAAVVALLGAATGVTAFDYPIHISAPEYRPAGASAVVPHDFGSFSFPVHWFADFCGNNSHPNLFSRDIFDLLHSKTGAHPFIRVGGTSTDRVWYNASQEISLYTYYNKSSPTAEYGIPDEVYIGPAFFDGFLNFPESRWSWQVNMGNSVGRKGGLANALKVAQLVVDTVQDKLDSFELGNEPNLGAYLYPNLAKGYDLKDYVKDWKRYAKAVVKHVLKGNKYGLEENRFFQALTFLGTKDPAWTIEEAFKLGIDSEDNVKSVSYHQYAAGNSPLVRLQNSYMNHTANAGNVSQYDSDIEYAHSMKPEIEFVLGETNSNGYNLNMAQVEGVFGSALWLIDHLMLGMAANITRYNLIQGTTFGYTGWVPVPLDGRDPYVRAPLYGQIFTADAIGHKDEVQVYPVPKLPWNMSGYGVYESGSLARYVVINYDEWNSTTTYKRPHQRVKLDVPGWADHVEVKRLTGHGANADEGIKWAGQSWNYTDGRLAERGSQKWESVEVRNGVVKLSVPSTEAVLVSLARSKA